MTVRRALTEELPALSLLAQRSFMAAVAPLYSEIGVRTFLEFASTEAMVGRIAEGAVTYGAYDARGLVGMAQVRGGSHLCMLFVAPEAQRLGVGRSLLAALLPECTAEVVTVNASPNAEGAYLRFGFRRTAEEKTVDGIRFIPMARPKEPVVLSPAIR
ncbi:MAG: GNAT family N-acetyltransferase [Opitutaceae bacterium]